jgi:hypothetical protein
VSVGDLRDRVAHLLDVGRGDEAVELLSEHLTAQPNDWYALCQLAWAHHVRNDSAAMSQAADAAVGAAPDQEWGHRLASIAALWRRNRTKAVTHAQEAVRLEPENWHARHSLSRALLDSKQKESAYKQALEAVRLAPLEAQVHLQVSVAAHACRRRDVADAALQKALELDPLYGQALSVKAAREVDKKRLGAAVQSVLGALRVDPQSQTGHDVLASVMTSLLLRLFGVTALGGMIVAGILLAGRGGYIPPYWPRALAGIVFIGIVQGVAWLTLRHLPPAARRLAVRGIWRGRRLVASAIFGFAAVCLIVIAFAPFDVAFAAAAAGGIVLIGLFRLGQLAGVVVLAVAAFRAGRRLVRRRSKHDG